MQHKYGPEQSSGPYLCLTSSFFISFSYPIKCAFCAAIRQKQGYSTKTALIIKPHYRMIKKKLQFIFETNTFAPAVTQPNAFNKRFKFFASKKNLHTSCKVLHLQSLFRADMCVGLFFEYYKY